MKVRLLLVTLFILLLIILMPFCFGALDDDILHCYDLDTATPTDYFGTLDGIMVGTIDVVPGVIGNSYYFNNDAEIINMTDNLFHPTDNFTVSFWINVTNFADGKKMWHQGANSGDNSRFFTYYYSTYTFQMQLEGGTDAVSAAGQSNNKWYHVALTRTGADSFQWYVNGTASGSPATETTNIADIETHFGGLIRDEIASMRGNLDIIKYWNRTLTPDEIVLDYNSGAGVECGALSIELNLSSIPTLNNTNPYTKDIILCQNASVPNGYDFNSTWDYQWYENTTLISGQNSSILNLSDADFDKGDDILCSIRAYDGDYSGWYNSTAATILNSPPSQPTTAEFDKDTLTQGEQISCSNAAGSSDDDSDSITYLYKINNTAGTVFSDWSTIATINCTSSCEGLLLCNAMASTDDANSTVLLGDNVSVTIPGLIDDFADADLDTSKWTHAIYYSSKSISDSGEAAGYWYFKETAGGDKASGIIVNNPNYAIDFNYQNFSVRLKLNAIKTGAAENYAILMFCDSGRTYDNITELYNVSHCINYVPVTPHSVGLFGVGDTELAAAFGTVLGEYNVTAFLTEDNYINLTFQQGTTSITFRPLNQSGQMTDWSEIYVAFGGNVGGAGDNSLDIEYRYPKIEGDAADFDDLRSYYPFNGCNGTDIINGYDWTLVNSPTSVKGIGNVNNDACYFANASNQYALLPDPDSSILFNESQPFSWQFWYKSGTNGNTGSPSYGTIGYQGTAGQDYVRAMVSTGTDESNKNRPGIANGCTGTDGDGCAGTGADQDNVYANDTYTNTSAWIHVVTTYSGEPNKELKLYINGSIVLNFTKNSDWSNNLAVNYTLMTNFPSGAGDYYVEGSISNVAIWNRTLDDFTISTLYNEGNALIYPFTESEQSSDDVPPTVPTAATLNNTAPYTDDIVNCSASGSTDANGDNITYFYKFNESAGILQEWSNNSEFDCGTAGCDKGDNVTCYAIATTEEANSTEFMGESFLVQNTLPTAPSDIAWNTTGGFTSGTRSYGQTLDSISATCTGIDADNDFAVCSITVESPTLTIIDDVNMTNVSTLWTYSNDILLDEAGNWTITIHSKDSEVVINTSDYIIVELVTPSLFDGFYAYDYRTLPSDITVVNDYLLYNFDTAGFTMNWSRLGTDYAPLKATINTSEQNHSVKSFVTFFFDGDYTEGGAYTSTTCDEINTNLIDFADAPFDESIRFIIIGLNETQSNKVNFTNSVAECIVNSTDNKFPIYVDLYSEDLDLNWVVSYDLITITADSNTSYINAEKAYLRNSTSLTRIYHTFSDELRLVAADYQAYIISKIRGTPTTDDIGEGIAEISNGDIIVFNNESTGTNFSLSVADADRTGKDVWDSTEKTFIEQNTDGDIVVYVPGYSFSNIYFDNMDYFTLTALWAASTNREAVYSWNNTGETQATYSIVGANDAQFYAWDPTYGLNNQFMIHYEWINSSYVTNYSAYCNGGLVIIADYNSYGINTSIGCRDKTSGYISVADYNDSDEWEAAKRASIDKWIEEFGINVFLDGLDTGASGNNFPERFRNLVDYVEIDKNSTCIANDYTSYSSVGVGGICDYDMKESFCGRWDGNVGSPTYSWEDWNVDYARAVWANTNKNPQLAMTFGDKTNNSKQAYCYAMYLVLLGTSNGNLWHYSQPNFQTQQEVYVFDPGDQLENTWTVTNSSYYYRRYGNGKVWIDPINHEWGIENNRVMNNLTINLKMQIYASSPAASTAVSIKVNGNSLPAITYDEIGAVQWATNIVQRDITDYYNQDGKYVIQLYSSVPANPTGLNVYNTKLPRTGVFSFWDNSVNNPPYDGSTDWNAYGRSGSNTDYDTTNWFISLNSDDTVSSQIDNDITDLSQSTESSGGKTNITISGTKDYNLTVWGQPVTVANYINLTYWNGSEFLQLNPTNTSTCTTNQPTWGTDVIEGYTHRSCLVSVGDNITVRVATPHLSEQIYQIDTNTPPVIVGVGINDTPYQDEDIFISANITDTGAISEVLVDFNNTNHTMSFVSGDTYGATIGSGNYSTRENMTYRVYALDGVFTTVSSLYSFVVQNYIPTAPSNYSVENRFPRIGDTKLAYGNDTNITFTVGTDIDDYVHQWISIDTTNYTVEGDSYKNETTGSRFDHIDLPDGDLKVRMWATDNFTNSSFYDFEIRVGPASNVDNLTNYTTEDHRIRVSWQFVDPVAYTLLYKDSVFLANVTYPTNNYTDYPVSSSTTYYYHTEVVDEFGRLENTMVYGESALNVTTPTDVTNPNLTAGPTWIGVVGQIYIDFTASEYVTAFLSYGTSNASYNYNASSITLSESHEIILSSIPVTTDPYYYNITLTDMAGRNATFGPYTFTAPLLGGSTAAGGAGAPSRTLQLTCEDLGMVYDEPTDSCQFPEAREAPPEEEEVEEAPGMVSLQDDFIGIKIGENLIKVNNLGKTIWPTNPGLGWVTAILIGYMLLNLLFIGKDYTRWWIINKLKK